MSPATVADGTDAEELADLFERLILNGRSVPAKLDQTMREAYRRVHLRGLDRSVERHS